MKVLVTGASGFIGFHVSKRLLEKGHEVIGLDSINDYYSVDLKLARLSELGIVPKKAKAYNEFVRSNSYPLFKFIRLALEDRDNLPLVFKNQKIEVVCNLAAQAGVRYSLENPGAYIDSNVVGFFNVLECCKDFSINHLVYASSSSVYGLNKKIPFETTDNVDKPISLYAATKKSNELMAHTYSHLFKLKTTGLRFFTVYGPWGRPDMAMFIFTKAILENKPIKIFNHGNMERDFTYIDDIVSGVVKIIETKTTHGKTEEPLYNIYNIGNNSSVKLMNFIEAIEEKLNLTAKKEFLPMQPGDVQKTWANVDNLIKNYDYSPNTPIKKGVSEFIDWYKLFYH